MKEAVKNIKYKTLLVASFMVLFWFMIVVRLFSIQVQNNQKYSNYAQSMAYKKITINSQRGLILDRNGKGMAINANVYSLAVHPHLMKGKNAVARTMSKFIDISSQELLKKFNSSSNFVWIDRNISPEAADTLKKIYHADQSIVINEKIKRKYPYNDLAGQTLGFTDVDNVGIEGLERALEEQLRGVPGYQTFFRTGKGDYETRPNLPFESPINGKNSCTHYRY